MRGFQCLLINEEIHEAECGKSENYISAEFPLGLVLV